MDSHCEVNVDWLEPLLNRIKYNPGAAVCPIIDVIDPRTLNYRSGSTRLKGGFDWSLQYKWVPMTIAEHALRLNDTSMPFA